MGTVIALVGSLGAGKTRFTQGIATGLEINPLEVNSPTFALVQEYSGRLPVAHFDTYRLRSEDEFLELGSEEYLSGKGVCIVEWADRVTTLLPAHTLWVRLSAASETERRLVFQAHDPQTLAWIEKLRAEWENSGGAP
ncbi:MAG: tRNA (adenosine(37)-N6)-threonylcarbamoyltransferase complex ATPase subunit type 1 TsaE [Planctomycetales bacterium]